MSIVAQEIDALSRRAVSDGILSSKSKGHIAIYNHIHKRILPNTTPETDCPPLHVLAYAVRANIQPTIVLTQIPATLRLLAHVECIRQRFAKHLDGILDADRKLRVEADPLAAPLTSDERIEIKQLKSNVGKKLRRTYREIVNGFSLYHVYETWAADEELEELLTLYFPIQSLWQEDVSGIVERYLFHYNLTEEEREDLEVTAQIYFDMQDKLLEDNPPDLTPEAFRMHYPCPEQADPNYLIKLTLSYLDTIEHAVQRVESVLSAIEEP